VIRIERDAGFWRAVASHPAVEPALLGIDPAGVGRIVGRSGVLPLAALHGGFIFVRLDPLGFTAELHTLFTPEGWGREVHDAGIEALNCLWLAGYSSLTTYEARANRRSRPPASFGFVACGDWRATPFGELKQWMLTAGAWRASPAAARRRRECQ
jgi:hypothetical protein